MARTPSPTIALKAIAVSFALFLNVGLAPADADVEISADATQNMTCANGTCSATAKKAVLNIDDLTAMLASGNVAVISGSLAKDIQVDAALEWTGESSLTLDSYRSIHFNKPVDIGGSGALTITTNDGGKNGDFDFKKQGHVEFASSTNELTINGHRYALLDSLKRLARELRNGDGTGQFFALQNSIRARRLSKSPIDTEFGGTFEGLGNSISHLGISSTEGNIGMFYAIDLNGTVRDLHLKDVNLLGDGIGGQVVGALAGASLGSILNCDVSGQITVNSQGNFGGGTAGGIVGLNAGPLWRSHSSVAVSGTGSGTIVGGLVGENTFGEQIGLIHESYSTGTVTGGDGTVVGGLIGKNDSAGIYDSYSTAAVTTGNGGVVGGLIGTHAGTSFSPVLRRAYSTGAVIGGSGVIVGGLIGDDLAQTRTTNSFWDMDTSGIANPAQGAGNVQNDPGITGLSDAQLKSGLPAGFDPSTWKESVKLNNGDPYLIDNPPPKK